VKVAVLTLTRDRVEYTEHCFAKLRDLAGCGFDHYVLDQASTDDTPVWLAEQYLDGHLRSVTFELENLGITRALNQMLAGLDGAYDLIVRFDNDCEVTQPGTLRKVCEVALAHEAIVAPRILGLQNPPGIIQETHLGDDVLEETGILGGIFMAIPSSLFVEHGFRYDESMPAYTGDEAIVPWWRSRGGRAGYLAGWEVNHYLTTEGQRSDPTVADYERRKFVEMGLA